VINIYEAKSQLSKLVDQAAGGDDVIIARHGRPVARLTRLSEGKSPVRFGVLKGKVRVSDDFDSPLPDEIIAAFEGR
jgi:prevent-host-death family protein